MSDAEQIIPNHLGLILDGNRRWAKANGLPTLEGHRKGYDNLKDIGKAAINKGVKYVSAYIFSTENWNRTPVEVKYLMNLAYTMLTRDVKELNDEGIRVVWLGSVQNISKKLLKAIRAAEETTANNTRGTLCICFNYGGQQEIADAAQKLINDKATNVTPELFATALYTPEVPPMDMLIRTSGEQRLSGFMLWRAAYAELYFVDKHWPDFGRDDLDIAFNEYSGRQRRFGK
jgi:undecaprenyl diphosphate synthase